MTEQEYKQKIDEAFAQKKWEDVILQGNELMFLVYPDLAKQEGVAGDEAYNLPKEKIFAYFQGHDFAPLLTKKGIASLNYGAFDLSDEDFKNAIDSLKPGSKFAEPYFYLAFLQYRSNMPDLAVKTLKEGLERNPQLLNNFDQMFNEFLAPSFPDDAREFKSFCKKL